MTTHDGSQHTKKGGEKERGRERERLSAAHDASLSVLKRAGHGRLLPLLLFLLLALCTSGLGPLLVSCLLQGLGVDGELDGAGGRSCAQVVHARLQALKRRTAEMTDVYTNVEHTGSIVFFMLECQLVKCLHVYKIIYYAGTAIPFYENFVLASI